MCARNRSDDAGEWLRVAHLAWTVIAPHSGMLDDVDAMVRVGDALFPVLSLACARCLRVLGAGGHGRLLEAAARAGATRVCRWVLSRHRSLISRVSARSAMLAACSEGHTETAAFLRGSLGVTAVDLRHRDNEILVACCGRGHLETARWLVESFGLRGEDLWSRNLAAFTDSCGGGHLEVARWVAGVLKLGVAEVHRLDSLALSSAALGGRLDVVKWILGEFGVPGSVEETRQKVFWSGCAGGNVEVAQLLREDLGIVPSRGKNLTDSCSRGLRQMTEWILEVFGPPKDSWSLVYALKSACKGAPHEFIMWLIDRLPLTGNLSPDDVVECFDSLLRRAMLPTARWFVGVFGPAKDASREEIGTLFGACLRGSLEAVLWAVEFFSIRFPEEANEAFLGAPLLEVLSCAESNAAQWMVSVAGVSPQEVDEDDEEDREYENLKSVDMAIFEGEPARAKWLVETLAFKNRDQLVSMMLQECCVEGQLELAQWVVAKFDIDGHTLRKLHDDDAGMDTLSALMEILGSRPHSGMIRWLHELVVLGIEDLRDTDLLSRACEGGDDELVSWLVSTFPLDELDTASCCDSLGRLQDVDVVRRILDTLDECEDAGRKAFLQACLKGNLDVAQHLLDTFRLSDQIPDCFRRCCARDGNLASAIWLSTVSRAPLPALTLPG